MTPSFNSLLSKNIFFGYPIEYYVSPKHQVIFVSDFYAKDVSGGAELTSEAILKKSPHTVFRMHSSSVNKRLIEENKDKYWVFGNYTLVPGDMLTYIPESGIKYSVIEFDFKFCSWRSPQLHLKQTGKPCDCMKREHGKMIENFYLHAEKLFWMSEGQKEFFFQNVPLLRKLKDHDIIQSSTFDEETLNFLNLLYNKSKDIISPLKEQKVYSVLGAGSSWIKGIEDTVKWCSLNGVKHKVLDKMPYKDFLNQLSQGYGLVFMPRDYDTCPRVVIEAKMLGNDLILNDNVQHKSESWFAQGREECEAYLRTRADFFWKELNYTP